MKLWDDPITKSRSRPVAYNTKIFWKWVLLLKSKIT